MHVESPPADNRGQTRSKRGQLSAHLRRTLGRCSKLRFLLLQPLNLCQSSVDPSSFRQLSDVPHSLQVVSNCSVLLRCGECLFFLRLAGPAFQRVSATTHLEIIVIVPMLPVPRPLHDHTQKAFQPKNLHFRVFCSRTPAHT